MHMLLVGFLLGMGAAIPVGLVNLEIIRRNLRYGMSYGVSTGLGACSADVVYLILLCLGAMTLLQYPNVLRGLGLVGSFVLAWFAYNAFRAKIPEVHENDVKPLLLVFLLQGFIITLINPYTILFWSSVSSQVSMLALSSKYALWLAGLGVILGTVGWVLMLNIILHFTRHHLTVNTIRHLNYLGGMILLGFAVYGIYHVFQI